ncbi:MAG TPA: (d)CMP kinase [Bdellovibrionota bacterium]|jgi:cytidylate kinase|nr:(d)CMP kinase [Bdellovibrionota bacterium]
MNLKLVESDPVRLPIVAIDGPAGAGKSTAARLLAYQLGFRLIDTGALYRSLALQALETGVDFDDEDGLAKLCYSLKIQFGKLEKVSGDSEDRIMVPRLPVFCNGLDVTQDIRRPEVGMAASKVSRFPKVRDALLALQRAFGEEGGIVMEGRDIGTVIFPHAELKFYLTASVESRAKRRFDELSAAGNATIDYDRVLRETAQRDSQDMNREIAPLRQSEDAILIDSTQKDLIQVVSEMAEKVRNFFKEQK